MIIITVIIKHPAPPKYNVEKCNIDPLAHIALYLNCFLIIPSLGPYLTDGPRSICVHGSIGSPCKWELSWHLLFGMLSVSLGVYRFDVDTLNDIMCKYNTASKYIIIWCYCLRHSQSKNFKTQYKCAVPEISIPTPKRVKIFQGGGGFQNHHMMLNWNF